MFEQVVYLDDKRYAGPACHPPPAEVKGLPTQRELDAFPRMFTWGELKDIIQRGDLEALMRNKPMQSRYDEWMVGMKVQYGSTGSSASEIGTLAQSDTAEPAALPPGLAPSTVPAPGRALDALSTVATPGGGLVGRGGGSASGAATPSSAGFVSLASLKLVNGKLRKAKAKASAGQAGIAGSGASAEASGSSSPGTGSGSASPRGGGVEKDPAESPGAHEGNDEAGEDEEEGEGDDEPPVYLRYDAAQGLDTDKYAVLYNDWPYNVPYGVSHHCVWSRVPIAHPELVDYDPEAWARIEQEGLGGFTGITPLRSFRIPSPPSSAGLPSPPAEPAEPVDPNAPPPPSTSTAPSPLAPEILFTQDMVSRQKYIGRIREKDWYAADIAYSGPEARRWAGVGYMAKGGQEIDKMVKGLWDERGWECLWFVNPPRLQSVPGFSHFHVFARRKTPQEIDASEAFWRDE